MLPKEPQRGQQEQGSDVAREEREFQVCFGKFKIQDRGVSI